MWLRRVPCLRLLAQPPDTESGTNPVEDVTMDELIKMVSQKTGLSEDMAKTAVDTVIGFLKDKLPAPVAGQIEGLLGGGMAEKAGDLTKGLGGLLGRK